MSCTLQYTTMPPSPRISRHIIIICKGELRLYQISQKSPSNIIFLQCFFIKVGQKETFAHETYFTGKTDFFPPTGLLRAYSTPLSFSHITHSLGFGLMAFGCSCSVRTATSGKKVSNFPTQKLAEKNVHANKNYSYDYEYEKLSIGYFYNNPDSFILYDRFIDLSVYILGPQLYWQKIKRYLASL